LSGGARRVGVNAEGVPATVGACPVLVERGAQLALLETIAALAAAGSGQLAVVTGEAGAGKSRLTREFAATLGSGWQRLFVHVEASATNPFGGVVDDVAAGDAPAGAIGSALGRALAERADGGPLLLVVEDLERADPVLIAALSTALDVLREAPVLLLAAFRLDGHSQRGEQTAALAETLRAPCAHEVRLESLSRAGVAQMAAAMGRGLSLEEADALHARGDGNPFFVEELLHSPVGRLPWTITEAIVGRLEVLPTPARNVAQALACSFDPIPEELIEDVVEDGGAGLLALVDAGVALAGPGDQISLRHALVCEVVAGQLTARERREWHRRLATALEAQPRMSAARLTRHWREAGDGDRAAHWALIAADEAARSRAYRTATGLYRIAVSVPPDDQLDRAELFDRAAVAAAVAGLAAEAFEWAGNADACYRGAGVAWRAVAMWLNPVLVHVPKPDLDYRAMADDAIPRLLVETHDATKRGELDEAAKIARRVIDLADTRSDEGTLWAAAAARRLIAIGRLDEGDAVLYRLRASAAVGRNSSLLSNVLTQMSFGAMGRGEIADCLAFNEEALALARDGQHATWAIEVGIALIYAYIGELDDASAIVDELCSRHDPIVTGFAQLPACLIDLERGDLGGASRRLERLQLVHSLGVADFIVGVMLLQARWHYLSKEYAQALATINEAATVTSDLFVTIRLDLLVLTIRVANALDDAETTARELAAFHQLVALGGGRAFRAGAMWAQGRAAAREGSLAEAGALLASAAEAFEGATRLTHAADAWIDVSEVAAAAGDERLRGDAIARARGIAEPRGLTSVLARLHDHGVASHDEAAELVGPLQALSNREREIAHLVAEGKTNREIAAVLFVSEHTVRNQLVNVFAKLGISRRTELARLTQSGHREGP
jgi:DNA-binding CsgD family transcriptional regulator